jgi:DNA recombination-dependent growth factor C
VLTENLDIKRVVAQDILDQSEHNMPVDANEQFDGDFTLMCAELNQMLSALLEALEEKVLIAKAA